MRYSSRARTANLAVDASEIATLYLRIGLLDFDFSDSAPLLPSSMEDSLMFPPPLALPPEQNEYSLLRSLLVGHCRLTTTRFRGFYVRERGSSAAQWGAFPEKSFLLCPFPKIHRSFSLKAKRLFGEPRFRRETTLSTNPKSHQSSQSVWSGAKPLALRRRRHSHACSHLARQRIAG